MWRPTSGFLEQDHSAKSVAKRQKGKSAQAARAAAQSTKPTTTSAPPKAVSTTTKAQLSAFAFQKPSKSHPEHNGKQEVDHKKKKKKPDVPDIIPGQLFSPSEEEPHKDQLSKECPQTPAPRLALKDLVKFKEDVQPPAFNMAPDVSPERIVWQVSPRGTPTATQMTPVTKRQRRIKRARSSSPIAPHRVSPVPKKEPHESRPAPTTPRSDAQHQYSDVNSGHRPPNHGVPLRLFSAEKRNSLNLSPLGLRRSYSCGDWPLVGLKRRRTDLIESHISEEEEGEFLRTSEESEVARSSIVPVKRRGESSKLNRVNMLLNKVHEKLAKTSTPPNNQSSSPPVTLDHESYDMQSSPTRNAILRRTKQPIKAPNSTLHRRHDMSDENYDDDFDEEIDLEILEKVEEAAIAFTQQQQQQKQKQKDNNGLETSTVSRGNRAIIRPASDFDEFDFGDDHVLDDIDVDALVSQTPTAKTASTSQQQNSSTLRDNGIVMQDAEDVVEEFGDIDFGEWDAEEFDSVADVNSGTIRRFVILDILENSWEDKGKRRPQKVLKLRDTKSSSERTIFVREDWYYVKAENGDIVHVIAKTDVIDNTNGMLIINPDFLVSSTTIADSFGCKRRAVLQDRVKATGDISKPLVYGSILHELFQKALTSNNFSDEYLSRALDTLLTQHIQQLYVLKEEISVTKEYLRSKFVLLQQWAKLFISVKPKKEATATDHRGRERPNLCINKLLDIEEHVWSPMYGIKGNIDATVQATIKDRKSERTLTVPLELKTGRSSTAAMHRAQTMIYTLLLKDRYDIDVLCGLLYYMESLEIIRVPSISGELRGMIIARNELAWYAKNRDVLPDMLKQHACNSCFARRTCFIYHKGLEDGTAETSGVQKQFEEITSHINDTHKEFLKRWDQLLSKEESDMTRFRKELWSMTSAERERKGRCFGNLVVIPESIIVAEEGSKVNRYTYQLKKADGTHGVSCLDSQIGIGDPIVISDEKGHFALAMGFVINIRPMNITVTVDRRLHNARIREEGFDAQYNQTFAGIMKLGQPTKSTTTQEHPILLRLDKDELTSGMALVRNNLIELLSNRTNDRTRELIIDRSPPRFKVESTAYSLDEIKSQLNCEQLEAVEKIMSAKDYALILGMPGTGKTTTIGHIINTLVSQGKSVLLTSYTHTAVDNILLKIKNEGITILRLGNTTKIHPEVKEFAILAESPRNSFKEIHEAFMLPKVVATTCLSINHHIFNERVFDYCIVDEASQITLPVCLGPIRMAKKFILVGDHYQLPPLVRNPVAKEGGLDISLFKLLSDAHPNAVVSLEHQYRMCEEIMSLSNKLIYDGRLKCGNEAVAKRTLKLPRLDGLSKLHSNMVHDPRNACNTTNCWIQHLLEEKVKVMFVNTDNVPASEVKKSDRIDNPVEAQLTFHLVESLVESGVDPTTIGVISVYRSQVKAIQYLLRGRPGVEMHTADKFQGRDKECIIISLVRSNAEGNIGDLLKDWRRINVAFTRARSKLIIFGSKSTLSRNGLLKKFVDLMEESQWIYHLPVNAHQSHTVQGLLSPVKREIANDENTPEHSSKVPKRPKTGTMKGRVLFAKRPVLKDIANDLGIFE